MANVINHLPQNATLAKDIVESFEIALETCSIPSVLYYSDKLPGTGVTFHELTITLSSIPTILCWFLSLYIIYGHYLHWVNPKQQKQIVLCVAYLPIFTVFNFFALWFYQEYNYITPILQLYNAKGLIAVIGLYVAYLCPEETGREHFHSELERRGYYGKKRHDKGSLRWFRIIWVLVFQVVPMTLLTFPINYIIQNVTCFLDSSRKTASLTLAGVQFAYTAVAWSAIFIYYRRTKSQLKEHRGGRKLNAFQSFVALQAIQSLVFPLATQTSVYYPTKYVSYQDFSCVIPAFMTCSESLIFAILFFKVFSFTSYRNAVLHKGARPATVERAVLDTLNQMDVVKGTVYMFQVLFHMADKADSKYFEKSPTAGDQSDDGEIHSVSTRGQNSLVLQKLNSDDP